MNPYRTHEALDAVDEQRARRIFDRMAHGMVERLEVREAFVNYDIPEHIVKRILRCYCLD